MKQSMDTFSITSSDGIRIVYNIAGEGSAIILLHGGGGDQTRQSWHQIGYVGRLKSEFRVISIDIRGHGESDKPTDPAYYTINKMCQDIISVADACDVEQFALWGFSYGGNIGRYLASQSDRVTKLIVMGIPFGLAASGDFRQFIKEFRAHWAPIVQAQLNDLLDPTSLSEDDQDVWQHMNVPVTLAWLTAMLDWGKNEPSDLRCPTLWLAGSKNNNTIASIQEYKAVLQETPVQVHVVAGLDHVREFEEIDLVFPPMLAFTKS
jgi:pimeloyl-ACP methyl ester carboxylesterase